MVHVFIRFIAIKTIVNQLRCRIHGIHGIYPVCCAKGSNQRLRRALREQNPRNKERPATARHGQEVLITLLGGDIDRPVIIGAVYDGQGADNQQSN
jgi:hypothetical protein